MKAININQTQNNNRFTTFKNKNNQIANILSNQTKEISFKSVFADDAYEVKDLYAWQIQHNCHFAQMKCHATRIFRELPSQLAIAKLLKPEEKNEIKILGCSDGSEAWAYAIVMKEIMEGKIENTRINALDLSPYMVELAQTGKIVCSDIEKEFANMQKPAWSDSPLKGAGWDKYLKKTSQPSVYGDLVKLYPWLKYLTDDIAVKKNIGNGLDWYEINQEGLPEVSFKQGNMLNNLTVDGEYDSVVYVVANSAGYILEDGVDKFIELFEKIKKENEGKKRKVYVVLGNVEYKILTLASKLSSIKQSDIDKAKRAIRNLGFEYIKEKKLRKAGIKHTEEPSSKILELKC